MDKPSTVIAMLAAGTGSRFGGAKLDAELGGKPVGLWAAQVAEAVAGARRMIVTAPTVPSFVDHLAGWDRVINPDYHRGMAASIRAAAIAAAGYKRLIIILADMPLIGVDHLRRLAEGDRVAFTLYPDGRHGVPAGFPAEEFGVLADMSDDTSPAALPWARGVDRFELPSATALMDVDTPTDLAAVRTMVQAPHPG